MSEPLNIGAPTGGTHTVGRDNLLGWSIFGGGTPAIPKAILGLSGVGTSTLPFNINMPANDIPEKLFKDYFMPYARAHWVYDGAECHCQMLGNALMGVFLYIGKLRKDRVPPNTEAMVPAAVAETLPGPAGFITKPLPALGGIARGNVMAMKTKNPDGRCYFPNHTFCKFGNTYYDPTFNLITANREEAVLYKITTNIGKLRVCKDGTRNLVFAWDPFKAKNFSDSWYEYNGDGWLSAQEWRTKTARSGVHHRSKELDQLDAALKAFEDTGNRKYIPLKDAFQKWLKNNPHEATARNKAGCVNGLAKFLGVPNVNYPNVV